jgi:hypothetical protein
MKATVPLVVLIFCCLTLGAGSKSGAANASGKGSSGKAQILAPAPAPRTTEYPTDGVELGNGWDSRTERKTVGKCIEFKEVVDSGQDKFLDLKSTIDNSSLMREMKISASFQMNAGLGSASTKVEFAKKVEIHDDATYFVVRGVVMNAPVYTAPRDKTGKNSISTENASAVLYGLSQIVSHDTFDVSKISSADAAAIDLTDDYKKMYFRRPLEFVRECGDSFVSMKQNGAELVASLRLDVHDIRDRESVAAKLGGSYASMNFSVEASNTLETYRKNEQLKILYHESGGNGDPLPVSLADLTKSVSELPSRAKEAPRTFMINLQRYDTLPCCAKGNGTSSGYLELSRLADQYNRLRTLYYQMDYVMTHTSEFILQHGVTPDSLGKAKDELRDRLDSINSSAEECVAKAGAPCGLKGADTIPDYAFRIRMPVRVNSFDVDTQISKVQANLALHNSWFGIVQNDWNRDALYRALYPNIRTSPRWIGVQMAVNEDNRQLTALQSVYPDALREAIYQEWIEYPNSERCRADLHSPECLRTAQLRDWHDKIEIK